MNSILIEQIIPSNKSKFVHRLCNHSKKVCKGKKCTFEKSKLGCKRDIYITQNKNIQI